MELTAMLVSSHYITLLLVVASKGKVHVEGFDNSWCCKFTVNNSLSVVYNNPSSHKNVFICDRD